MARTSVLLGSREPPGRFNRGVISKSLFVAPFLGAVLVSCASTGSSTTGADAQHAAGVFRARTAGMQFHDGFFPFHWDRKAGKVWLEIPRLGEEFLYVSWLTTGLGSNPVGLDRGQAGAAKLVRFERVGSRVFLRQRNLRYRARSDNAAERRAVAQSFATSTLWAGDIVAAAKGRVLVDFTDFVLRDVRNVVGALRSAGEGAFHLERKRSSVFLPNTKAFPRNTEFEASLTFVGDRPGRRVRETTPTPSAITLRERHSFVALPEPGYVPRKFDPRSGSSSIVFADYAAPLNARLETRWLIRHRLVKKNPGVAVSEPVQPIVYYLDPGAPEPVRSALLEGARWWNEAFEAAGYRNAFRVEMLPPDADPLDVRYNVIQWVHRSTRGWSYGNSIVDPRTGEIIKGHVSLGSLRVRQDRLIFDGIAHRSGACDAGAGPDAIGLARLDANLQPVDVALARIRQLAAHEVGHTLGFAHNFAASAKHRASVMDYPGPLVRLVDGRLDLRQAYATGIGAWDRLAVRYAYAQWPNKDEERRGLESILEEAVGQGLSFLTDQDARPPGAAHPNASLWDNGSDAVAELERLLAVRAAVLERFGARVLREGSFAAELEDALVPAYLLHRYQIDAAAKSLGGVTYEYAQVGGLRARPKPVPAQQQRRALDVLLSVLTPKHLALPRKLVAAIPPKEFGHATKAERFPRRTAMVFDPVAAAEVVARLTVRDILQYERAARLTEAEARDSSALGFADVVTALVRSVWEDHASKDYLAAAIERDVRDVVIDELIALAGNARALAMVRAIATDQLAQLERIIRGRPATTHGSYCVGRIHRFLTRAYSLSAESKALPAPAGSPIGATDRD